MNDLGETIPDPVEGKPIETTSRKGHDGWAYTTTNNFDKCKQYLPATWPVKIDPKQIAKERPFSECMRKRGMYAPEPDANGMVAYPANPEDSLTPEYHAAEDTCRYLYDDPANNQ